MTDDLQTAFARLTADISAAIDTLQDNAVSCERLGEYEIARAYRRTMRLLRRINAGEPPGDFYEDRTSETVFGGDPWQRQN